MNAMNEDIDYESWAYLNRVVEGPSYEVQRLLAEGKSVGELVHGIKTRASWLGKLGPATETRWDWDRAQEDLYIAREMGARLVTPESREWPRQEFDQAFGFAASGLSEHIRSYQEDAFPPHGLWVRGEDLSTVIAQSVAVVGTRAISRYGHDATRMIVKDLASAQWTVVSGGALGVDTVAHQTALEIGAPTVAVQACGIDQVYPARNKNLFSDIAQRPGRGCIVTEYPPEMPPHRHRFLTRNRLVAALTKGTVVVEAGWRSGALNTLSWAEGLGKVPMAVPGPITTNGSLGCNARLKEPTTQLVTSGEDVRELLSPVGDVDAQAQLEIQFDASPIQKLTRNELRVFDAMELEEGKTAEDIATSAGLTLALTIHILVALQNIGLVHRAGVRWQRRQYED